MRRKDLNAEIAPPAKRTPRTRRIAEVEAEFAAATAERERVVDLEAQLAHAKARLERITDLEAQLAHANARLERMSELEARLAQADAQRAKMAALEATITELDGKLSAALQTVERLQRQLFGKKSEKMPRPAEELRKTETKEDTEARRLAALEKRRERAAIKEQLRKETVVLKVLEGEKACPACGGVALRAQRRASLH